MPISTLPVSNNPLLIVDGEDNRSLLNKLAALVAQIYLTFSQISQNERKETLLCEQSYKLLSNESADLTRSKGRIAIASALVGIAIFAASAPIPNMNDKKFVQLISERVPEFFKLWDTDRDSSIQKKNALTQLESIKLQDKNNRSQTDGNLKEQFSQALQAEIQRIRSASSHN